MKKVLLFLAAAAMLAVSCAKDPQGLIGDQTKVTFTVDASQVATRAVTGTHGTATRLMVGVYIKNGTTYNYIQAISQSNTVSEWPTVVSLDLAKNETYKLVFWADEGTDAYTINWANGTVAEAATTIAGNATNRDAYYKMVEITTNGANGGAITLTRPLAQVNVGTNDLAAYKAAAVYDGNIETQVVVSGVVPGMNLLTGEASTGEPVDLTFSYADNLDATLVSGGNNYGYLGMNFVLCPGDATLTAQISLRKDDAAEAINEFTVSYLPVKTNYRTNIVGKLLTGTVQYSVDVDTDFADDLQKLVAPTFESIEALNTYLAGLTSGPANGDHGDIKPEVAIVSGIGDVKTIVLPNDTLHLALQILAAYNGDDGLTIAYPTGEGAKHTKVLYVTIPELSKLTANLPDTHLELVTGSSVDLTDVHTSENTFVIQEGARVGRLNINQGNAEIAGAVANVYVVADATSNGETPDGTNPVQVFLTSESAVEKIHLSSQSDVTVEQPKDHIDVEATEKKVAVYVNEGADNSSATAQNGGVIYVEANVPCTVTADGTSTAEEGNVSSTVIINENANGSAVVATNGGAIELTANGNCDVTSTGTSEGTSTPSTVNIDEVKTGAEVNAVISQGGEVNVSSGVDTDAVDIKEGVAMIGDVVYLSLAEAVAAVPDETPTTIVMIGDDAVENGITIAAEKIIVLELAGHTVSGNTNSASTYALITNRGTLTIQDNTDTNKDGTGTGLLTTYITNADQQDVPGYASNTITNNGTLTVKSGKLVNNGNGYACYAIDNVTNGTLYNPVVRIEGGCMEQMREYTYAVRMFCNSQTNTNTVEVTGGVIQGGYGFWLQMPSQNSAPDASLTISGGTIISRDGAAAYIASSYNSTTSRENVTVNISGGTFTGSTYGLMVQGVADGYAGFKEFDISGGIISGIAAGKNLGGFISGGYFGNDPTDFVSSGCSAVLQEEGEFAGWYKVVVDVVGPGSGEPIIDNGGDF